MNRNFTSIKELEQLTREKQTGSMVILHLDVPGYPGMVLYIGFHYDSRSSKYQINLEWMSFGLDFYGDTLQESYMYQFTSLQSVLDYLKSRYEIDVTDIPVKYSIDSGKFPNPIRDADKKELFEAGWNRFREDFRNGKFLDSTQELICSSLERE